MKQIVALVLLTQSLLAGAAERPEDFAYGIAIHADARDPLYEITLPAAVYRGVTRSDLGDIRVFNARDEVVPYAFMPRAAGSTEAPAAIELPLFPLYVESGSSLEDLNVRIDKRADGTIVNILNRGKGAPGGKRLRGFVLDASGLKRPVQALEFDWKSPADGFAGKVRIEGGNDLARWHVLTDNASLVSLDFAGRSLRQKRVELRVGQYKYLRVSWPESQPPLELLGVRAEPAAGEVEAERVWQAFTALPVSGKAGEYVYDLGGHFPFDRLRVELPQVNTLVQVQMLARANPSDDWRLRASAVTYRLLYQGEEVTSPEIAVASSGEPYWLLRVDQKGGGVGAAAPVIHIGWPPQKLVFAARGASPFQLAYGNSQAKPASYRIDSLIPGYKTENEFKVMPATLGEQVTLSGAARLRKPPDYKKWALWGSLILGVCVLGWMAYRLSRQMAKPEADSAADSGTADKLK
jgi:Protein of unknown function (DUF3999)